MNPVCPERHRQLPTETHGNQTMNLKDRCLALAKAKTPRWIRTVRRVEFDWRQTLSGAGPTDFGDRDWPHVDYGNRILVVPYPDNQDSLFLYLHECGHTGIPA